MCGYGGISRLEVGGVKFTPSGGHQLDIGELRLSHGKKVKVLLYNSGPRTTFIHAMWQELESHTPLPDSRAHIIPPNLVIPAHSTGEIQLFYHPNKMEEEKCRVGKYSLARLVIYSGDECVRQKLVQAVKEKETRKERSSSPTTIVDTFAKDFPGQEKVVAGMCVHCTCVMVMLCCSSELVVSC